jgi:copper(I)-binding protein
VKASTDTTLLSILPERFLSARKLQNIQLMVRLPKAETTDAINIASASSAAATAAATATTTSSTDKDQTVRARSDGSSDVLMYSATVQQAIDTLKQLQRSQSSSLPTDQKALYIEVYVSGCVSH